MTRCFSLTVSIVAFVLWLPIGGYSAEADFEQLAARYIDQTRPLLKRYCLDCHSTELQEGELDLERFARLDDIRASASTWLKVVEMLDNGEMPPKDHQPQPSADERQQLRAWVREYLDAEALAGAGDPGPIVMRRLSNAEYTYTIRDLTGVALDPAKEFPADSAAGEGFTNAGGALVMSPALLAKYFDAAKQIAQHAVLLPDGFRFSPYTTRRDWTGDTLERIRAFYGRYAESAGGSQVNLQGIVFNTNEGGRLPVEAYLAATLAEREALRAGRITTAQVAQQYGLNAKYLDLLWQTLTSSEPSPLLDVVRQAWRDASPEDAGQVAERVRDWQAALWRFSSVGHIGKVGGPRAWQEPVTPLAAQQELRWPLPAADQQPEAVIYLAAGDAGDGHEHDYVVWHQPRLVAPGRPELLLRDLPGLAATLTRRRAELIEAAPAALAAAAEAQKAPQIDVAALSEAHGIDAELLAPWLQLLGIGSPARLELDHFTEKLPQTGGYDFVQGWGSPQTPSLVANASDQHVRVPGNMKPHGVCVHPSPTLFAAVGWQSPLGGTVRISGAVTHAHPECGNGVTWSLELRRGTTRQVLASGAAQGAAASAIGPLEPVAVQPGDLVSLLIGPRDGNHSCDLTDLELVLTEVAPEQPHAARQWNLAKDISGDVLAGNPHADRLGNPGVWHFYTEPIDARAVTPVLPAGSLLARWQISTDATERQQLAQSLQQLLVSGPAAELASDHPDRKLYYQLRLLDGPLLRAVWDQAWQAAASGGGESAKPAASIGIDPARFGKHPEGQPLDAASVLVRAPEVLEVRLPTDLFSGAEFMVTVRLDPQLGREGTVQAQLVGEKPEKLEGLQPASVAVTKTNGPWTSDNRRLSYAAPILVNDQTRARQRVEAAMNDFRSVFPIALCYTKIVPVDEVVTLTLYHREDEYLQRLMLDESEAAELNRLWEELHFVSHDALTLVDAFEQLLEYASQDADPKVFEPMREPIQARAQAFRETLLGAEPKQIESLIEFAARAYRRPLTEVEIADLRQLYDRLRDQQLAHDEAFRLMLARILIAPAFLYRIENQEQGRVADARSTEGQRPHGIPSHPISDWELASRLSYFLWASQPDQALRTAAAAGTLHEPEQLEQQTRRMLQDPRMRRWATEFACQWLHVYQFDTLDEKSERLYPEFAELRGDMYEETILFFTDLVQHDRSLLDVLDADHTFANRRLAEFYNLAWPHEPGDAGGSADPWQRITGVRQRGRGGILGLAATLAKHSGASRTSPTLRGNWISEVLLGEKLPKPPKDVPQLPEEEAAIAELTVRQLVEKHSSDPRCASCHVRVDPFGFALENYDAIGRRRERDSAGRSLDTQVQLPDGAEIAGLDGLRNYLRDERRDVFVRQFCRKLLGYALGRGVQLSDEPLIAEMQSELARHDHRISAAILTIVRSRQFREIRSQSEPLAGSPLE